MMKKLLFPLIFILFNTLSSFAQEEEMTDANVHEIGVDVSPLLQTAFGAGNVGSSSPYTLMYRYHLERWALRAAIGGVYTSRNGTVNDTLSEEIKSQRLSFRLGVERKWNFAQSWQFFYGLDFRALFRENQRTVESNTGWWSSDFFLEEATAYGAAPFLGFRFRINERLSLTTHSSLWIFYDELDSQRILKSHNTHSQVRHSEGWETSFTPPTSLFLTLHF